MQMQKATEMGEEEGELIKNQKATKTIVFDFKGEALCAELDGS